MKGLKIHTTRDRMRFASFSESVSPYSNVMENYYCRIEDVRSKDYHLTLPASKEHGFWSMRQLRVSNMKQAVIAAAWWAP